MGARKGRLKKGFAVDQIKLFNGKETRQRLRHICKATHSLIWRCSVHQILMAPHFVKYSMSKWKYFDNDIVSGIHKIVEILEMRLILTVAGRTCHRLAHQDLQRTQKSVLHDSLSFHEFHGRTFG